MFFAHIEKNKRQQQGKLIKAHQCKQDNFRELSPYQLVETKQFREKNYASQNTVDRIHPINHTEILKKNADDNGKYPETGFSKKIFFHDIGFTSSKQITPIIQHLLSSNNTDKLSRH